MAVMTNNTSNVRWELIKTTTTSGNATYLLATAKKYVAQDIYIQITTPAASSFTMAGSSVTSDITIGSLSSGYYPLSAKIKGTITAGTPGWFTNSGAVQASTATQVGRIKAAAGKVTLTAGSGSISGTNCTLNTTNNGISVTGSGTVTAAGSITTAGYAPTSMTFSGDTSKGSNTATKYIAGVVLSGAGHTFTITVPNGTTTADLTLTFTVNSDGKGVTIT